MIMEHTVRTPAEEVERFWLVTILAIKNGQLEYDHDFDRRDNKLVLHIGNFHGRYMEGHRAMFHEQGLPQGTMLEHLIHHESFSRKETTRIGAMLTVAFVFNLEKLPPSVKEAVDAAAETAKIPPYRRRVIDEKKDLDTKLDKLSLFTRTDTFNGLPPDERERLHDQRILMKLYSRVLGERIAAFPKND